MKRTEPRLINDIINDYLRADGLEDVAARQRACAMWPEIVGPGINRLTSRRYVTDDGVMHVYLTSASLKQELSFMRQSLIESLNRTIGSDATVITDLIIH